MSIQKVNTTQYFDLNTYIVHKYITWKIDEDAAKTQIYNFLFDYEILPLFSYGLPTMHIELRLF